MGALDTGERGVQLNGRRAAILHAVCRDYVMHAGEVSSKALVRAHGFRCSSATLRQELAALERSGLVRRRHRSAGCTPTRAGLAHYVAELQAGPSDAPSPDVVRAVDCSLRDLRGGPEQGMRAAVCVLSEVSGCLAVTFVGGGQADRVRTVELVPLVGARMLAVVEMEGGATHMHTVGLEPTRATSAAGGEVIPVPVDRLRSELRRLCAGKTLPEAREEVLRRMTEREAHVDRILGDQMLAERIRGQALALALVLSSVGPLDPLWLQIAGGPSLTRGGVEAERLGEVLALLEDDQRLAEVLSQLVGDADGVQAPRAHVHVGPDALLQPPPRLGAVSASSGALVGAVNATGTALSPSDDGPTLTLVGCPVPLQGSDSAGARCGVVALIGPDRMDYASVIPLVEYAARALAATIEA